MKHLLPFVFLLVSFSTALADTPAKIAEDYRKAASAALTKLNGTLEQAATPLIAKLISSGDTDGADALAEQLKVKLAGEPVATPQASATLLFAQYDQARAKALEPVQKASISRIESLVKSTNGSPKLETLTELSKVRAEIEAGNASALADSTAMTPKSPAGSATPKKVAELVKALGGNCINGSEGEEIAFSNTALSAADLLQMGAAKRLKSFSCNGGSGLTDEGMAAFEGKKNLSNLFLWAAGSLSDEGLKSLSGCDKLETLNIGSNGGGITGSGFESLSQCKALRQLTLNGLTGIEGRNLRFLSQMKSLEVLSLSACKGVTDEDMEWIAPMTHLKKLRLGGTSVTDAGLARLTGLRHLEELIVTAPQVTPAGVEMLKKSSPGLVVIFAK